MLQGGTLVGVVLRVVPDEGPQRSAVLRPVHRLHLPRDPGGRDPHRQPATCEGRIHRIIIACEGRIYRISIACEGRIHRIAIAC